eukprot:Opistho-2@6386
MACRHRYPHRVAVAIQSLIALALVSLASAAPPYGGGGGNALLFDGKTQWVSIDSVPTVSSNFTIEMYVNPCTNLDQQTFIMKLHPRGGTLLEVSYLDNSLSIQWEGGKWSTLPKLARPHHFAFTSKQLTSSTSQAIGYIDGVEWGRSTQTTVPSALPKDALAQSMNTR